MKVLNEKPYSILKMDRRGYQVLLLRDQSGRTFGEIAGELDRSVGRVLQIYRAIKVRQKRLYLQHLSLVLGKQNAGQVEQAYAQAYECYQSLTYACAYLEVLYPEILAEYRAGEPGMPPSFLQRMPPLQPAFGPEQVARVVNLREAEKATFASIAETMQITPEKARHTYDWYYHVQTVEMVKALQAQANSPQEEMEIWEHWFRYAPKKRYDLLTKQP